MKGRLVVSFVNEQGMLEAGLDYGGLVKEFLEQVATARCSQLHCVFISQASSCKDLQVHADSECWPLHVCILHGSQCIYTVCAVYTSHVQCVYCIY